MAELTPEMQAAGIFLDASGNPTWPDGTPALRQNQPPPGDGGAGILAQIAQQAGLNAEAPSGGRGAGPDGKEPPADLQYVGGFPYPQDPVGYSFGPFYNESPVDYRDTKRGPPLDPEWVFGMEGGDWHDYYTPYDQSTGGGFFLAKDAFGGQDQPEWMGNVPFAFQEGSTRPSTNNWRLFGGHPGLVMRNGRIIDLRATDLHGPPVPDIGFGNNYGGPLWNTGAGGGAGFPAAYNRGYTNFAGWPGTSNWANAGSYWIG